MDATLTPLSTLQTVDKTIIRNALVQHRYKILDDVKKSLDASKPFEDRLADGQMGLDEIRRCGEMIEVLWQ